MIHLARKEAIKSDCRSKHGAVIVRGGSVLSKAHNIKKVHHTYSHEERLSLHAEINAIRKAINNGIDVAGATIYLTRGNKIARMSKPCSGCMAKLIEAKIKKVVYTNWYGCIEVITL